MKSSDLLHAMSWKNLNDRLKLNKLVLIYKILNNHSAPNLKDKFIIRKANLNNYNLRMPTLTSQFLSLTMNI